jgi:putative pyruvate formate lyase activating enzyme
LAREVERLRLNGCRNINMVGGEPTPWLQQWMSVFKLVDINVPVVWNSNAYYSPETAKLLADFVDVYLLDFKYGPGECAEEISEAPDYWDTCTHNHLEAQKSGEIIVRILVLPNHLECCTKPTLNWVAENLGVQARVNLMFQYRPEWRASEIPELRRKLWNVEMDRAIALAKEAGLVNFIT